VTAAAGFGVLLGLYLFGAFVWWDLNAASWPVDARGFLAFMGAVTAPPFSLAIHQTYRAPAHGRRE